MCLSLIHLVCLSPSRRSFCWFNSLLYPQQVLNKYLLMNFCVFAYPCRSGVPVLLNGFKDASAVLACVWHRGPGRGGLGLGARVPALSPGAATRGAGRAGDYCSSPRLAFLVPKWDRRVHVQGHGPTPPTNSYRDLTTDIRNPSAPESL